MENQYVIASTEQRETCNKCMPFFHDRPWKRGTKENPNECVRKYNKSTTEVDRKSTGSEFYFIF